MLSRRNSLAATLTVDFSPFLNEPAIVLAVSGGSDSTALMVLAHQAHAASGASCRLVAVTVDHGLRPDAADEARIVSALAESLGIEHRIVEWPGSKPRKGIQAAAREARLGLLARVASDLGARVVLTGHTADDQVETVLMRAARGEGIGLAGIAPATLYRNAAWFARPLLGQRRTVLRAMLIANRIVWSEDPSNRNLAFERVRVRNQLAEAGGEALFDETLAIAGRAAAERETMSLEAAGLIDRFARLVDGPVICFDAGLLAAEEPGALHALRLLIATAAGASHLPDAARAAALMHAMRTGDGGRAGDGGSLANARIRPSAGGFTISRDRRGYSGPPVSLDSPFSALLPSFDLTVASAIARLLGQSEPAVTPWT